jgi:NAD(P)-dependent dehydrogenase (short-subunit alcohol dehydrogenase family)
MTHPFSLSGRTVLVTGATAGIGRQTALSVAQMGARVIVTGRNAGRLTATHTQLEGSGHVAIAADLADEKERERLVGELPALDGIAHCAGVTLLHPFKFSDERRYREVYSINVEAPLFLTQRLFKHKRLANGGSIVFIASLGAFIGARGHSIYAGSKAAIVGIMRVLAHELAGNRIRVNCVSPGMVKTEVVDGFAHQVSAEVVAADEARYPLGYGTPEDVANTVVFYLAPASKWITGTNLIMDGGLT